MAETMTVLAVEDREDALWRAARGVYPLEASVLLLAFHDHWLRDEGFAGLVDLNDDVDPDDSGAQRYAFVNWNDVAEALDDPDGALRGSGSAVRVLRIAMALADGPPVNLSQHLSGLDDHNRRLVLAAIDHAQVGFDRPASRIVDWPAR